jgi:ketosteroid isomerase-like protein
MPNQHIELLRRAIAAYNARDIEAFIAYCDPNIEFHSAFAAVGGVVYRGHEGLRSWHQDMQEAWGEEIRLEAEGYFDLGEHALAFHVVHGRGRYSGVEIGMPFAMVARYREGLIVYWKGYAHRDDALSDLGVSKDKLEPIDP